MLRVNQLSGFGGIGAGTPASSAETAFYSWGQAAQVGNGTFTPNILVPTTPSSLSTVTDIVFSTRSAWAATHMGFIRSGDLYMVGNGTSGQLGLGNFDKKQFFTKVTLSDNNVSAVAMGRNYTLILREGVIWGSGNSNVKQTGDVATGNTFREMFTGGELNGQTVTQIFAGDRTSMCITGTNEAYAWGEKICGGMSIPTTTPVNFKDLDDYSNVSNDNFVSISIGDQHFIALDAGGNPYVSGIDNSYGQTGLPFRNVGNFLGVSGVAAGSDKTVQMTDTIKIAAGQYTSYILDVGDGGRAGLWGAGQGNNGEMSDVTSSQINDDGFLQIDTNGSGDIQAGRNFAIRQLSDGTLYHTGKRPYGENGNGVAGADIFGFVEIDGGTTALQYAHYVPAKNNVYGITE